MEALDPRCANVLRGLAIDMIQKANSGHPGMPLGFADAAFTLWHRFLKYDPSRPDWPDRDRFVLSAGHASSLLYGLLHLTGVALTLDDLQRFRQLDSLTTGHPEHGLAPMIETTTGPLGQGFANGVGMAIAEAYLRERFGAELCDHYTYVAAGDGDLMEGVQAEAASLAGHLRLGRLVVLYDDNRITIDGGTDLAFTEDRGARFAACGWHVQQVDGHDMDAVAAAIEAARLDPRPSLIVCRTTIGFGSPNKAGRNVCHGAPLGPDEVRLTKLALGLDPEASFAVPDEVVAHFRAHDAERCARRMAWEARLEASDLRAEWDRFMDEDLSAAIEGLELPELPVGTSLATREAGGKAIQAISRALPQLLGGSADLAHSNLTYVKDGGDIRAGDFKGRNLHFGIREHAMAAICNGLSLHGGIVPFCATFMVFHDYMRPAVRLSAFMERRVVYVYTHDSIFVGEDGPTHQPIEQLMALRGIPGLVTLRPADANETFEAWRVALARQRGPTALALTRQALPVLDRASRNGELAKGAYVLREASGGVPRVVLMASGSEVALAMEARARLEARGYACRVVSFPSWELFDAQDAAYRESVLPPGIPRVSVEAGRTLGWERYTGLDGARVGIDTYGISAPAKQVAERLGLSVEAVVEAATGVLGLA